MFYPFVVTARFGPVGRGARGRQGSGLRPGTGPGAPRAGPALTALGGERLSQGDVTGALRVFEKATRLFPAVSLAWYNVAVAYGHAGLLQHAGAAL